MAIISFERDGKTVTLDSQQASPAPTPPDYPSIAVSNSITAEYERLRDAGLPVQIVDDAGNVLDIGDFIRPYRAFGNPHALVLVPKNLIVALSAHGKRPGSHLYSDSSVFGVIPDRHVEQIEADGTHRCFFLNKFGHVGTFTVREGNQEFHIAAYGPDTYVRIELPPTNGVWNGKPTKLYSPPDWVTYALGKFSHATR